MTPWQIFKEKYQTCEKCELHKVRRRIVLAKGTIPSDVTFIGEAPGPSENKIGSPFIGPAGHLLDRMVERAEQNTGKSLTKSFTNLICCIPKSEDSSKKFAQPPNYAIKACSSRLIEFVKLCQPRLIVLVGQLAVKYVPLSQENLWELGLPQIPVRAEIMHPAAILRMKQDQPESSRLEVRRSVIILEEAFSQL